MSYWLDAHPRSVSAAPLAGRADTDLCIVGGGFTGLWCALHAKADAPGRDVVVLEAETVGHGATGRNGGFVDASLTHGVENGYARFADGMEALQRLGPDNFSEMRLDLGRHGIETPRTVYSVQLSGD